MRADCKANSALVQPLILAAAREQTPRRFTHGLNDNVKAKSRQDAGATNGTEDETFLSCGNYELTPQNG